MMSKPLFTSEDAVRISSLMDQFQAALTSFAKDAEKVARNVSAQLAELNKEKN